MLETLLEYDHIILCLIGMAASRRDKELSDAAAVYTAVIVMFTLSFMFVREPSEYGRVWYLTCAGIEFAIIVGLYGLKHEAAKVVMAVSAVNIVANIAFYCRSWTDKEQYSALIQAGEYAQAICIIWLSPPAIEFGRRREQRKKEHTWLARSQTTIG